MTGDGVAIKKVTNVFSKKILAKRALREIKLLQHFRGHRNVRSWTLAGRISHGGIGLTSNIRSLVYMIWTFPAPRTSMKHISTKVRLLVLYSHGVSADVVLSSRIDGV